MRRGGVLAGPPGSENFFFSSFHRKEVREDKKRQTVSFRRSWPRICAPSLHPTLDNCGSCGTGVPVHIQVNTRPPTTQIELQCLIATCMCIPGQNSPSGMRTAHNTSVPGGRNVSTADAGVVKHS